MPRWIRESSVSQSGGVPLNRNCPGSVSEFIYEFLVFEGSGARAPPYRCALGEVSDRTDGLFQNGKEKGPRGLGQRCRRQVEHESAPTASVPAVDVVACQGKLMLTVKKAWEGDQIAAQNETSGTVLLVLGDEAVADTGGKVPH